MTIDGIPGASASGVNTTTGSPAGGASATEDRFLKLLVSQMQNQDPLNPLDNAQVTSQMAQLSTVSGIDKLNASFSSLLASITSLQSLQASAIVGHDVAVEGDGITLAKGTGSGAIRLDQAADAVSVAITDADGNVLRRIDLGARASGVSSFTWDGKDDAGKAVADGSYRFRITATAGGQAVTSTALSVATVKAVVPSADGPMLDLGARGTVAFATVTRIL